MEFGGLHLCVVAPEDAEDVMLPLQLWGGVECTFNRVRERFLDQCSFSGHLTRIQDLDLIADLGMRKVRYPVLWERHAPDSLDRMDFTWADERLGRLRELGIGPIVGLVHHGSGPRYTDLLDPEFGRKLAVYARAVAARYPWVKHFTPVNEPLTTARFSGLYGHWYPHGQDELTFVRCLLSELKGTVLAMRAVREVTPDAQLVQTEDMAKIFSTPALAYQAEFENERRWVTFDLLTGRLTPDSRMYQHWADRGLDTRELDWFLENPCPPDIIGTNYYVTSERFLDDRLHAYPQDAWASNGRQQYADVAACHVRGQGVAGLGELMLECAQRYGLPMAVTEAHMGCTREEQVRWLAEMWEQAEIARRKGADVRAVTAWCMFGAYHWNKLVTCEDGGYEPGVFDLRGPAPRPTALAHVCKQLATDGKATHPVLGTPGWWRRATRFIFPVTDSNATEKLPAIPPPAEVPPEPPLLVIGSDTMLGSAIVESCEVRGLRHVALRRDELDAADAHAVEALLTHHHPWAVIDAGHLSDVVAAERDPLAYRLRNVQGRTTLAEQCAVAGCRFVMFSSDQVFDGSADRPYVESDPVKPLNEFGRCDAGAEKLVLGALPTALVVRTGPLFGHGAENMLAHVAEEVAKGRHMRMPMAQKMSPTYVSDLVCHVLDLLVDGAEGLWHMATPGAVHWAAAARELVTKAGMDPRLVAGVESYQVAMLPQRPRWSVLASERHTLMPELSDALERYASVLKARGIVGNGEGMRVA
jgi:dTDP-4-dehydrorhamnose reductase